MSTKSGRWSSSSSSLRRQTNRMTYSSYPFCIGIICQSQKFTIYFKNYFASESSLSLWLLVASSFFVVLFFSPFVGLPGFFFLFWSVCFCLIFVQVYYVAYRSHGLPSFIYIHLFSLWMRLSKIVISTPTRKIHLGRPRRRWEDNIRMDLEEIGINAGNWVDSAQDRNYWRSLVSATLPWN